MKNILLKFDTERLEFLNSITPDFKGKQDTDRVNYALNKVSLLQKQLQQLVEMNFNQIKIKEILGLLKTNDKITVIIGNNRTFDGANLDEQEINKLDKFKEHTNQSIKNLIKELY